MSDAAPSFVSRQLVVPGFSFSRRTASLYGGGSSAIGEVVVVVETVVVVDAAAVPGVFAPSLRSTRAPTTPSATTAAPPSANS